MVIKILKFSGSYDNIQVGKSWKDKPVNKYITEYTISWDVYSNQRETPTTQLTQCISC